MQLSVKLVVYSHTWVALGLFLGVSLKGKLLKVIKDSSFGCMSQIQYPIGLHTDRSLEEHYFFTLYS